jgi:hypothetical protein
LIDPSTLPRAAAGDEGLRLLLDPYLCFGPGTEHHAQTLAAIVRDAVALGFAGKRPPLIPMCCAAASRYGASNRC